MQSYQNVSNSQPEQIEEISLFSCKRLCKVIKMLAIHNQRFRPQRSIPVANAYAKLSKCQQFTTKAMYLQLPDWLQTLMQSYQNVSNSQLTICFYYSIESCKRLCKVIKMLAIHNTTLLAYPNSKVANAYAKLSKCQQFTTTPHYERIQKKLQTLMQSYQNVSNSQLWPCITHNCCSCKRLCKVIKMLAIHNQITIIAIIV